MIIEVTIPTPGESVTEVELSIWLVEDGDYVEKNQEIAEVESDKATLALIAEQSGKITILVQQGETVKVGTTACTIDTSVKGGNRRKTGRKKEDEVEIKAEAKDRGAASISITETGKISASTDRNTPGTENAAEPERIRTTPLARKLLQEHNLSPRDLRQGVKKITTQEVNQYLAESGKVAPGTTKHAGTREIKRDSMSQLRKKLSRRLVAVKNETAMLTTFNEVDMSEVIRLRKDYQQQFEVVHGIKLGFMSFFVKASTEALLSFPRVNSMIEGEDILTPQYVDISIAVQTEKGLMVPVLRNTETMSFADIEKNIRQLAEKARSYKLSIEEMTGGTFSITNGGIFGSMLSTPLINPPQSAILGMHNILERPVAIHGKVEIRPVMYVALSYDHRLIDGRDSVSFLVRVKELLESPVRMLFGGREPEKILLEI